MQSPSLCVCVNGVPGTDEVKHQLSRIAISVWEVF